MKLLLMLALIAVVVLVAAGAWLYAPDKPRAELEAKYGAGPAEYRDVAGIRLHVRESGPPSAPAVIMLHGFGSSLQTWEPWAVALSARYRVIRFDLPGFGLSGTDPTGDYSDRRAVQVLKALMVELGLPHASLIGNSLGGKIAWQFAAQYPALVDKLVLVSPDGFASPGFEYGKRPQVPWVLRLLPYVLPRPMLRASLAPAYGDKDKLTEAVVTRYRDMMLAPGVRSAIVARTGQVMLQDPVPLLRTIQAPTLLLWGDKDGMIPITNAPDYLRAIPHATLVTLPGLGHVPFEEAPEQSLAPVKAFLSGAG